MMISVIVPVYNEEKRIVKCLTSLLNQTYKNIEIIVVNDGSIDGTLNVLKQYQGKIKIVNKKNGGQGSARNLGIKNATGKYLTFVDGDDYVDVNMIQKLVDLVNKEKCDIAICDLYKIVNSDKIIFKNLFEFSNNNVINYMLSHPGPVGRLYLKTLFTDNKLYFLENCIYEDLGVIPLIGIYAKKISYIEEPLYYYVIRAGSSMTQVKYSQKLEDIFYIIDYLKNEFYNRSGQAYNDVLEYLYIEHLLYSASLRFIRFGKKGISQILKSLELLNNQFPNWKSNKYYKKKSFKFKIICLITYHKHFLVLKLLSNLKNG